LCNADGGLPARHELGTKVGGAAGFFLSCLRGSEQRGLLRIDAGAFLSCLRGSEPWMVRSVRSARFLSCLRGSEPR